MWEYFPTFMETIIQDQFFLNPMARYGVRELARITKLDAKTVMKYLQNLVKDRIVIKRKENGKYPYYEANRLSYIYRHEKSEVLVRKILASGLIDFLEKEASPKVIILFGSIRKGTYHRNSDVDLFVQTGYTTLNLQRFNAKIGHKVQLLFEKDLKNFNSGLLENIYNGLVLAGKIEVPIEAKGIRTVHPGK